MTFPKTTCFPSKKSAFDVVIKNCARDIELASQDSTTRLTWQPLVLGPELAWMKYVSLCELHDVALLLAIDRRPGPVCFSWKFSSFERVSMADYKK